MKLLDYMKSRDLDDAAFAALLGPPASAWSVKKWKYGESLPRAPQLARIEEVTDSLVKAADFVKPEAAAE